MKIQKVYALEILDSRGNPTVEAHIITEGGHHGYGMVPSGASTGIHEAVELRDGGDRYRGKGVLRAVHHVNTTIQDALKGVCVTNQEEIDNILSQIDGTENKSNLGANAMLAVSMAALRGAACAKKMEIYQYLGGIAGTKMPLPMMNIINGGAHASNNLDIQEFMIVPVGAETFSEGVRMCAEVYHTLKEELENQGFSTAVGDEGGFAPKLESHEMAIEQILKAVKKSGYQSGVDIKIALDAAASEWFDGENYQMPKTGEIFTKDALLDFWEDLISAFPIISIEDPAAEDDWETWRRIMRRSKIQIVGDDLFVTNTKRLQEGISQKAANAILIKPNQIGTVTETIAAVQLAKSAGMGTIISHRSGDTEDSFIADLAVGLSAGQIKTGAPCRSERTAKYNRLLYIDHQRGNA